MPTYKDIILSTDIECDGPQIGRYSMRSFGSVAIDPDSKTIIGRFSANLKPLPNAKECPNTVDRFFKAKFPDAWDDLNQNPQDPATAMNAYMDWLESLDAEKIWFTASPISYDKAWVVWYIQEFCADRLPVNPHTPFTIGDFDINSWQAGLLGASPLEKRHLIFPSEWTSPLPHPHIALMAAEQAADEIIRRLKWMETRVSIYQKLL
jgi:hypothetical protein